MFELHVSYNCGITYCLERTAETLDELRQRMRELDDQLVRWYLTKDGEDYWEEACGIHKGIHSFIQHERGQDGLRRLSEDELAALKQELKAIASPTPD